MNEELKVIISAEIGELQKAVSDAQKEINSLTSGNKVKFEDFNKQFQKVGDAAKKGLKVAAGAVAGLTTAFLALGPATEEYRTAMTKLDTAFQSVGGSAETAEKTYNNLYRVLGDSDVAVEAANHLAKLTTNEQELTEWTNICQGVYATFGDSLPIEGLTEAINHTAKLGSVQGPLADALEWSGISADDFNTQLAECSTEAERAALIQKTLNGVYGEAAAAYEENAAGILAQNEAQASLNAVLAKLGEVAEPIITMLTELASEILADLTPYIQDFAEKHLPKVKEVLSEVGKKIGEVISWIVDHWDLVSTVATVVLGIVAAVAALSAGLTAYNAVMGVVAVVTSPVGGIILAVVAAITALVAIIVVCVKHWDEIKAKVIEVWENIKQKTTEAVENVKAKFNEMKENISAKVENIKSTVKEKFNTIKETMGTVMEAAKSTVSEKLNNIKNAYNEHGGGIKGVVSGFMEAVKGYYSSGFTFIDNLTGGKLTNFVNTIKSKMETAKNTISNILNSIKSKFTEIWDNIKNVVSNAVGKLKDLLNFEWNLPKLKLPHFSISGEFSLNPPSIPRISVEWYQKGGIFDEPTLFPFGGNIGGLGENGAEAIVPLEKNTQWMNVLAEKLSKLMGTGGVPIVLQVDGKTFAQMSVDSINQLTKQRGSLPLILA